MLLAIIRVLYFCVCAGAIATYINSNIGHLPAFFENWPVATFVILLALSQIVTAVDVLIQHKRLELISAIYFGILVGVLLSYLLVQVLERAIHKGSPLEPYHPVIAMLVTLIMPYLCTSFLLQTKDDFRFLIPYVEFSRELKGARPLILDSSALIDGRIADVVETRIIESKLIVPEFVVREVQDIADSSDKIRRSRGRRGLDVLNKLQHSASVELSIHETESAEVYRRGSVDQRLISLAKELGGRVVTNDFNLNKVASVHGVDVINLNDVANSLKPRYLPGEHLSIKIIKEGESAGQGVGYLDDGTMVVCEQASNLIGQQIDAAVTSVLQSSAGRMIFARQVNFATKS